MWRLVWVALAMLLGVATGGLVASPPASRFERCVERVAAVYVDEQRSVIESYCEGER